MHLCNIFMYVYILCVCVCVCACMCVSITGYFVFHYSEFSDNVTYSCAAAAPEAPPTPECVDIGVRHVTVRWSSPDDNGGDIFCVS